jgi:hypothetical protein
MASNKYDGTNGNGYQPVGRDAKYPPPGAEGEENPRHPPPPPPPPPRVIKDSIDFNIFLSLVPILFVIVGFVAGLACGQ